MNRYDAIPFFVHDANGTIYMAGSVQEEHFAAISTLSPADTVRKGVAFPQTHYWANGALQTYTPAQQAVRAVRPSLTAQWNAATMVWDTAPVQVVAPSTPMVANVAASPVELPPVPQGH